MKKLTAIIESAEHNYSAYIVGLDGVIATGDSIESIKNNLLEAIEVLKESCLELKCEVPEEISGEYSIEFKMDVKSLLDVYAGVFSKAGLERMTGINQKQLWHYANGYTKPRPAQKEKIEKAIHRLGEELLAIHL